MLMPYKRPDHHTGHGLQQDIHTRSCYTL
jgi:hypothetical protein